MDHVEDDPRELARKIEQADRIASRMLDQTTVERLKSWATVLRDRLKRILRERRIREEIAARARDLWDQNGRPEGRDLEFWLQAESEIRDRYRESSGN
jgi:Protein of unknown function (DUF2934)